MIKILILLAGLGATTYDPHLPVADGGYVLGTGYPLGMLGFNVCTQVADDTTPDLFGAVSGGCNILETSASHTGPITITDLDNPLVGAIVYIVGADSADVTTIADSGNFNLERAWVGTVDQILVLYVQADNDYVEVTRHNGARYFDGMVYADAGLVVESSLNVDSQTIWVAAPTADTVSRDMLVCAAHNFPLGSQNGALLVLSGGLDEKVFESTSYATSTGDTLAVSVRRCTNGVCAGYSQTLTESTHWDCDVTSNAVCACALYDYLIANPIQGVTPIRSDGTCSDALVGFTPTDGTTHTVLLTAVDAGGGGVGFTASNGTDGVVSIPQTRHLCFDGDWDTCISLDVNDVLNIAPGGTTRLTVDTSGIVLSGIIDMAGNTITDLTDGVVTVAVDLELESGGTMFAPAVATDAAAYGLTFKAGNPLHTATVNTDGANNLQCGGIGVKSMAVVQATADTSTITITTTDAAGTYTSTTLTLVSGAPGANEIQCITSDAVCAAAIVTYLASNVTGVTAEAVTAQVYLIPSATMCAMGLASADGGGTKFVLTTGTDGVVVIGGSPVSAMQLGTATINSSGNTLYLPGSIFGGGNGNFTSGSVTVAPAGSVVWDGLTQLRAGDSSNDGHLQVCNAAQTYCFTLAATAANSLTLRDKAGTGLGNLVVTGATTFEGHVTINASKVIGFGGLSAATSTLLWSAVQTPYSLMLGLGTTSRGMVIYESGDSATDFALPQQNDPTFAFQSSDATTVSEGLLINYAGAISRTSAAAANNHNLVFGTGTNTNVGDYDTGNLTYCSTGATTTDGDTGDCIAQTGASGDGAGVDAGDHIWNINGANEVVKIAGATSVITDTFGAGGRLYLNATTTKHTQTAGVLDINMAVADGTAGGQVALDVSSTTPAEGLSGGEAQFGISASITGDAQDNGTSIHIVNQVAYTPNGGGGTSYGYYAADTDFDYGFYTTAPTYFGGVLQNGTHTETIADESTGAHATATITPTANFILCDCDDAHGCTITMGETGMVSGMRVTIVGETGTHCDFSDTDNVSNLTGAFVMSDDDTLELVYSVDEWVEVGRSDN